MVAKSRIVLETERLRLRTWNSHYADLLGQHCNTDEVMEHLGGRKSPVEHWKLVEWLIRQQADHGFTFWAVETKTETEFLGFCGLIRVEDQDSTVFGDIEIGWRFRTSAQGEGYVQEAGQAILQLAFKKFHAFRVVSRTVLENIPSWKRMNKLGMWHDPRLDYFANDDTPFIVHVKFKTD